MSRVAGSISPGLLFAACGRTGSTQVPAGTFRSGRAFSSEGKQVGTGEFRSRKSLTPHRRGDDNEMLTSRAVPGVFGSVFNFRETEHQEFRKLRVGHYQVRLAAGA